MPAEASGIITLKAEEGDAVAVGAIVCLIDTSAAKPEGDDKAAVSESKKEEVKKEVVAEKASQPAQAKATYASGVPSPAAKKILDEKGVDKNTVSGSGRDGRITKEDAVNAVPSMGSPTGGKL